MRAFERTCKKQFPGSRAADHLNRGKRIRVRAAIISRNGCESKNLLFFLLPGKIDQKPFSLLFGSWWELRR